MMRKRAIAVLALAVLLVSPAVADVKLPAILGSNMVLQQGRDLPIWGWADPGEQVTVTLGKAEAKTQADGDGNWQVTLPPQKAGGPVEIKVAGKNTVTLSNVLIGELWVCSGQSNMAMTVNRCYHAKEEAAGADLPKIRLFTVHRKTAQEPQDDCKGAWQVCSPKTVPGFSAVGFFFGRKLQGELGVPVGLVNTSWGGTPAEAWTETSFLTGEVVQPLLDRWQKVADAYPEALKAYQKKLEQWKQDVQKLKAAHQAKIKQWQAETQAAKEKAKAEGTEVKPLPKPQQPKFPRRPRGPRGPHHPHAPSVLYNGMIHPLLPLPVQGAIWYQGESNAGRAYQYRTLFPQMIKSWRKAWGDEELEFYFVQLANFMKVRPTPPMPSDAWAELREAQIMTLSLPGTGMACIIDIGEARDIHPKNKQDVGVRLAHDALAKNYGKDVCVSGPTFDSMTVEGRAVRVKFTHLCGGLVAAPFRDPVQPKGPPLVKRFNIPLGEPKAAPAKAKAKGKAKPPVTTPVPVEGADQPLVIPRPESQVYGFAIAGEDQKFVWAEARIDGDTVVVSSPEVENPVAVRYAFESNPICNLYNKAGLPAIPFRTDDWPGVTEKNR
jgi:sialate O-acetylesterase